ncbi:MAG: hypothetical protein ACREVK_05120 [Gammaproteobacteria bacterium]
MIAYFAPELYFVLDGSPAKITKVLRKFKRFFAATWITVLILRQLLLLAQHIDTSQRGPERGCAGGYKARAKHGA